MICEITTNGGSIEFTNSDSWLQFCRDNQARYASAAPYPHIVISDFLPQATARALVDEFPSFESMRFKKMGVETTHAKASTSQEYDWGPATRSVIAALNSQYFLAGLSELTGFQGLVSDPYFEGGGLHQIGDGGFLKIHADFNVHTKTKLWRRLNLLLYLNEDWAPEFGGALELWDESMRHCVEKVEPLLNRCVIFSTTSTSYHGHPDPLTCGERTRKSVALYYYSAPESPSKAAHSTLYQNRPSERIEGLPGPRSFLSRAKSKARQMISGSD